MYKKIFIILLFSCALPACTHVFFQPIKEHQASPEQFDIQYEDIYFNNKSGPTLHAWWFASTSIPKANIIFLHGNGANISSHAGLIYWLTQHQFNVFIFDYRGYGKSAGSAEIDGILADIQSARDYVLSRKDRHNKTFIIGHSLGASLGIVNLAQYPDDIDGMIFISPFSDYRKITQETLSRSWITWLFQWPATLTISADYDPIDAVHKLPKKPKLFIYSELDPIIPSQHILDLYSQATSPKNIEVVSGQHNNIFAQISTRTVIVEYLNAWIKP